VMGSPKLAARHFTPMPLLTKLMLLEDHPVLPVPALAGFGEGGRAPGQVSL
jgi:hypothetical protein